MLKKRKNFPCVLPNPASTFLAQASPVSVQLNMRQGQPHSSPRGHHSSTYSLHSTCFPSRSINISFTRRRLNPISHLSSPSSLPLDPSALRFPRLLPIQSSSPHAHLTPFLMTPHLSPPPLPLFLLFLSPIRNSSYVSSFTLSLSPCSTLPPLFPSSLPCLKHFPSACQSGDMSDLAGDIA